MLINVIVNGYLLITILGDTKRAKLSVKERQMMGVFVAVTAGLLFYPTFFYLVFNSPLPETITQTEIYGIVMVVIFGLGTFIPTANWYKFWKFDRSL